MHSMDKLIKDFGDFSLWSVSYEGLYEFAEFVVSTNISSHCDKNVSFSDKLQSVLEQEKSLFYQSKLYAVKDCNSNCSYLGSIRLSRWSDGVKLPITETFGINISELFKSKSIAPEEVWHVGRLAVSNKVHPKEGDSLCQHRKILKLLIAQVLVPVCRKESNVLLAECDEYFLKMIQSLQMNNFEYIGKPIKYTSSLIAPVMNTVPNLIPFIENLLKYCYV